MNWNLFELMLIWILGDTIFLHQGGRSSIKQAEKLRARGCATFHPNNDDIVFIFGGSEPAGDKLAMVDNVFKYQISDSSHHELKRLDDTRNNHACMGFITRDGKPVSLCYSRKFSILLIIYVVFLASLKMDIPPKLF